MKQRAEMKHKTNYNRLPAQKTRNNISTIQKKGWQEKPNSSYK
jgi:hypothetical protein